VLTQDRQQRVDLAWLGGPERTSEDVRVREPDAPRNVRPGVPVEQLDGRREALLADPGEGRLPIGDEEDPLGVEDSELRAGRGQALGEGRPGGRLGDVGSVHERPPSAAGPAGAREDEALLRLELGPRAPVDRRPIGLDPDRAAADAGRRAGRRVARDGLGLGHDWPSRSARG